MALGFCNPFNFIYKLLTVELLVESLFLEPQSKFAPELPGRSLLYNVPRPITWTLETSLTASLSTYFRKDAFWSVSITVCRNQVMCFFTKAMSPDNKALMLFLD